MEGVAIDGASDVHTVRESSPRPRWFGILSGFAVLVLAWTLLIPPFGGTDEFDHAYRAAATARGQWFTVPSDAARGTGAWLDVPPDIVAAARPECQARSYTTNADCIGTVHDGSVRIASGAGRYHPLYYAVVGTVALPFHGEAALYAMRLATALLCVALLGLGLVAIRTWARTEAALLALVVSCTPIVVYSCAIVAPNGVEIIAALTFWVTLVGLAVADTRQLRRLAVIAAVSGAVLCTLRPLGPWWCLLIVLVVALALGRADRLRELLARRDVRISALVVAVSALQGAAWTVAFGALKVGAGAPGHTSLIERSGRVAVLVPLWLFQSVAAFPMRDDATSPLVYALYFVLFGVVLAAALRSAGRRVRNAIAVVAVVGVGFAFATTMASYDAYGAAWQGRYGLPLAVGMVVLGAYALDRRGRTLPGPWPVVGGVLFVVAQVVSAVYTLHVEVGRSPLAHSSQWPRPPIWLVVAMTVSGAAMMWWGQDTRAFAARPAARTTLDTVGSEE